MKTLPLLFVSLIGLTDMSACASTRTSAQTAERSPENQVFDVIPLQFAASTELAHMVGQLWPDARVLADGRTNSVLVCCASEAQLVKVRECIAKLDVQIQSAK